MDQKSENLFEGLDRLPTLIISCFIESLNQNFIWKSTSCSHCILNLSFSLTDKISNYRIPSRFASVFDCAIKFIIQNQNKLNHERQICSNRNDRLAKRKFYKNIIKICTRENKKNFYKTRSFCSVCKLPILSSIIVWKTDLGILHSILEPIIKNPNQKCKDFGFFTCFACFFWKFKT